MKLPISICFLQQVPVLTLYGRTRFHLQWSIWLSSTMTNININSRSSVSKHILTLIHSSYLFQVFIEQNGMGDEKFNATLVAFDVDVSENLTIKYTKSANGTFKLTPINRELILELMNCDNGLVCYFPICLAKILLSTTNFPTRKLTIQYHATRGFQFRITYIGFQLFGVMLLNIIPTTDPELGHRGFMISKHKSKIKVENVHKIHIVTVEICFGGMYHVSSGRTRRTIHGMIPST